MSAHPGGRPMSALPKLAVLASAVVLVAAVPSPAEPPAAVYQPDPDHPWNRLHQALFVREASDGRRHVHATDPLLYRGGTFLLAGDSHRRAVAALDQFLAAPLIDDPVK